MTQWLGHGGAVAQLRLVLDTNVVVSVLLFGHRSLDWMMESWKSGRIVPIISGPTSDELLRVLSYRRFNLRSFELQAALDSYLPWAEEVNVPEGLDVPNPRDPNDKPFLELAIAGNADALVTGDNDLLALTTEFPVPIITPSELREWLSTGG